MHLWHNLLRMVCCSMGGAATPSIPWKNRLYYLKDHNTFKCIPKLGNSTSKLALCLLKLSEMQLDVFHCVWTKIQDADALSRLPTAGNGCATFDDALPVITVSYTANMTGKDASKPTTSLMTAMMLALTPPLWSYPLCVRLRRHWRVQPHPR